MTNYLSGGSRVIQPLQTDPIVLCPYKCMRLLFETDDVFGHHSDTASTPYSVLCFIIFFVLFKKTDHRDLPTINCRHQG